MFCANPHRDFKIKDGPYGNKRLQYKHPRTRKTYLYDPFTNEFVCCNDRITKTIPEIRYIGWKSAVSKARPHFILKDNQWVLEQFPHVIWDAQRDCWFDTEEGERVIGINSLHKPQFSANNVLEQDSSM